MRSNQYTNLFLAIIALCLIFIVTDGSGVLLNAKAQEPPEQANESPENKEPPFTPWKCVQVKDFGDQPGYQRLQQVLNTAQANQIQMMHLEAKDEYSKDKITACFR